MPEIAVIETAAALAKAVRHWRNEGQRIALVPTMGGLHEGHLSLIDRAREKADRIVVSIFVNPAQFGPDEDFAAYPRDPERDLGLLAGRGADAAYVPEVAEIYPPGFATLISPAGVAEGLCGAARPGHFAGVATVITRLFLQCRPDMAVFGEKDYQQLLVIRQVTRDLGLGVAITGAPIVREDDGLALSSRNLYLDRRQRRLAPGLYRILSETARAIEGRANIGEQLAWAYEALTAEGFDTVDYVELRDAETLAPVSRLDGPSRLLAAARLGPTRLIDNLPVNN